jgi:hypothetical protein
MTVFTTPLRCACFQLFGVIVLLSGSARAEVVQEWNDLLLSSLIGIGPNATPPDNARSLAMVSLSVYEATNSITQTHESYLGSYQSYTGTVSTEIAAAKAARDTIVHLYGSYAGNINYAANFATVTAHADNLLNSHIAAYGGDPQVVQNSLNLGAASATSIISTRANDGFGIPNGYDYANSPQANNYSPQAPGPGVWQPPIIPGNWPGAPGIPQTYLAYYAASAQPFALTSASQFRPGPPPALTSAEYTTAYNEVKAYGSLNGSLRTAYQTETAKYWADGAGTESPPGHWNSIAQEVSGGLSTAEKARLFALLNIANADVAIATWEVKNHYHLWRPNQAITALDDTNPDTIQDSSWTPLIGTPPFPAYTSGHSGFSNSSAEILALYFGTDNIAFSSASTNPNLDDGNGQPLVRSYNSFSEAALEAGQSRIYGGIHFQFDNEAGQELGQNVANYTYNNFLRPVAVPEPGSALLVMASGLCLGLRRRRK